MSKMDGLEEAPEARPSLDYPCGDPPEPGTAREIAPGVHWIGMPLPFSLARINLWLIEDGDGFTLVDTGLGFEPTREHWRAIFRGVLAGKPITRVICTHMHPDHIGLAGWITRKFDCALWTSRLEYMTCRVLVADTGRDAPEDGVRFYRAAGWDEDQLDSYRIKFGGFGKMVSRLPDSYRRLSDGDVIDIGGRPWRIVVGCGHSPEHVCLWQEELGLFISGDQVLPRISSNVSVFPTEPAADPLKDWLGSLAKLERVVDPGVLVLPAHNEPFRGLHKRLRDLSRKHELSLERLARRLGEGEFRAVDLFPSVFGRQVSEDSVGLATGETLAHLNCLIGRGLARRRLDETGVAFYSAG